MATEARKLRVGIFVIAAIGIGLAAAIWLGASRFLADEEQAVTYFSESVQGLDPGAAVKFRGVPAGRVEHISIAPDDVLIEVVMSLRPSFAERMLKDPDLRAQLQLSGITGLRYVEIDRHSGDACRNRRALLQAAVPAHSVDAVAVQGHPGSAAGHLQQGDQRRPGRHLVRHARHVAGRRSGLCATSACSRS